MKTLVIIVKLDKLKMGFQDMIDNMQHFAKFRVWYYFNIWCKNEYDKWQGNDPPALPFEADVKLFREFYVQEINDLITLERFFQSDYVYLIK